MAVGNFFRPRKGCTAEIYEVYTMVVRDYSTQAPTTEEIKRR